MDVLVVVLFGLTPALSWGVSDFLYAKSSQRFGSFKAALAVNSTGALVYGLAYVCFLHRGATFSAQGMIYAVIGSISFGLAQVLFSKSLEIGPVSLASPISSTYPLVALVLGLLLFHAKIALLQIAGIGMIVAGVMIASGILQLQKSDRRLGAGPLFALGAAVGWGVGLGFVAHAMTLMTWQGVFLVELLTAPAVLLVVALTVKRTEHVSVATLRKVLRSRVVWATGVIQMVGLLMLNLGMAHFRDSGVVIVAISSCYPALTIFLALQHLDEKVPLVPLLGGMLGVVGVVVLALGGA